MAYYCLSNYRTDEQLADMLRLEADGVCIFCPQHLTADPDQRIVYRGEHWIVTPNEFPYRGTLRHLLLIPDEHVSDLADLPGVTQQEFWAVLGWVRDHYGLAHYGLGVRNGDCRYTGGTIVHVHVHVIVGDVHDPEHQPVRMKLSSRAKPEAEEQLRRRLGDAGGSGGVGGAGRVGRVDPDQFDAGGS